MKILYPDSISGYPDIRILYPDIRILYPKLVCFGYHFLENFPYDYNKSSIFAGGSAFTISSWIKYFIDNLFSISRRTKASQGKEKAYFFPVEFLNQTCKDDIHSNF